MSINVRDLPPDVATAVARARAAIPAREFVPIDTTPLSPEFAAWARDLVASGDLKRALLEVAATDPELATEP